MSNTTLIAVDHGNYAIKTLGHSFISGLSEHLVKPPLAADLLEYEGKFWTLSADRISYKRDKTRDDRFFILTLFAVAKELQSAGELSPMKSIDLAIGLPPEHFGSLHKKFIQYFKRPGAIKFVYNETPVCLMIREVFVYPQAFAAVALRANSLAGINRLFAVDIGGYTTDVLLLRNGRPDMQFCRSLEIGIITMHNDLIGKVNSLHDMTIEDEHISAVLQGQHTILPDEVKQTIMSASQLHAENILDKLRELKIDLRSNPAIFIGGGSVLLKPFIEASPLVAQSEFIMEQNANALGYQLLASAQLQKTSC